MIKAIRPSISLLVVSSRGQMLGISVEQMWAFFLTCLVIESTPGPNMAFLAIVSAANGRRYGYATTMGIALGLTIIGLAAAAGLASVISRSPLLYQGLRIAGVLYLLYLAWESWQKASEISPGITGEQQELRSFFRHGLLVNIFNPKAAVFYIAILPTFINMEENITHQAVFLTFMSVLIATLMHIFIVSLAGVFQPLLVDPILNKRVRKVFAVLLALIAIWFGWSVRA